MKDIKKPFLKSIISLALVVALVVGAVPLPKFDMEVHAATQTVTKTAKWDMDGGKSGTTTKTDEYTLYSTSGGSLCWSCSNPNVNNIYMRYDPQHDETGRTSLRGDVLKYGGIAEFPNIEGKVTKVEISNIMFTYGGADTNVVANMYVGIDRNSTSTLLHIAGSTDDYDFPSTTNGDNTRSVTFEGNVDVDTSNTLKLIFYGEAQENEIYPVQVMFVGGSITVTYEVEEEIIGDPGHSFSYTTNGNTLTATCNQTDSKHNCDLTERKATLTLTANDSSYDGSLLKRYATLNTQDFVDATGITGITSTFSYVNKSTNEVTTDGVVQPGEYTVTATIKINETNYTLTKDFSINVNSHSITNNYSQFTLNKITANPGDEITISIDQSIILTSLSVVGTTANLTLDNNEIRYSDQNGVYFFRMPDEDVTISATWQKLLTNSDITVAAIADQTYTGSAIEPAVTVLDGETDITDQCDITFSNNTNVGTATVTITAKTTSASYSGSITKTFSIVYPTVSFAAGDGGSGNMDSVSLTGTEYTLPTCTFTAPENKTFKEWSVKIGDAAPVSKQPNDTIEVTANTTVTAVWKDIHTHNFTYTAEAAVITATCDNTDGNCPLTDHKATLTIAAPLHTIYGDGKEAAAEITDLDSIKGDAKVHYQQKNGNSYGTATETAPTDAGDYMASITLGNATASVEYNIAKADSIADPPTASATYGQTLSNVELTNPTGNTSGTWAWVNDGTTSVGSVGNNTFKANFTPSNTNYSDKNNVDVVVTVSKAAAQTITDVTQNLLYTDTSVSASVAGKMPEDAGTLTYTAGAANTNGNVTVSNFAVDTSGNVTATISGGVSGDTITLPVTISSTNYADSSVNVNITLIAKNIQTITASDVTATYGDTGKSISANVTEPATGGGTLSYAVKSGDAVTVDASSGALTIVKTGTAIITVTAAETATYAQATKDVTVTVDKADPVATAPTGLTAAYGQTLADITLTNSESNTPGTWAWVNEGNTSVGNAGNNTFKVNFTPTDTENYNTVSNVDVTVNVGKADPTATAPSASATYGQTLDDVTLNNPTGNTVGTWEWVDSTTSVGTVGSHDFPANFTPNDTENYNSANNVNVTVTVGKADNPATVEGNATVVQGGNTVNLAGNVTKNGATGTVSYEISGEANGCTMNGSKLISGTNTGNVTVNVTVAADDNYNALIATPITVSITAKNTQTITASDVTATYGDTGKSISASVTESSTGGGTLSYAVKSGSDDYIGVDDNGKLTIKAVPPTDGKAYVTVTAAETADYAAATKDVTVTIGKATLTVAAKDQNIYVGDNVPSLSEPVLNTHYTVTGLVGKDALTTAPTLEYKKEGSTVTPNNTTAGTYDIVPSGASAGNNYNVSYQNGFLTISEKDSAAVTKVPKAKNLTYNGSAQELVTAGEADGGDMYYALGTETEATETYSTSIPTGTEAKTYYVWYKAIGDGSHSDTEPKAIAVTIGEEIIIRYDSNGGSGSMKDQKIEKGVETELKTNTFTRENYSFKEWNTKSDGNGDSYKDKAKVTLNDGMTLYAQWKKVEVHNHTFEKVDAVEPGCETDGNKAYYRCTGCDKWFADAAGSVEITDKNSVIRKATGHRWDSGEVTKEATYTETGIRTYTCKNDGNHTKDEVIPVKQRDYSSDDRDSDSDDSDSGSSSSGVKRGIDVNSSSEATGNSSSGTDTSTNSGLSSGTTGMTAGSTGGPVTYTTNSTGTAGTNGNVGTVNGGLIGSTAAEGNRGLYDSGHQAVQVKEILSLSDMLAAVLNKDAAYSGSGVNAGYQVDALLIDDGMPLSDVGGTWSSGSEHWHYTKSDGTEARDEWLNLSYNGVNCWYLFDEHGDMATGWVDYKGERYYLVPETDGWKGRMAEGWVRVDDKWYYFESTAGSTQGRLLRNGFTPDGHFVGDDGALVQ